ncbi:MAG TPA: prolyl oligopeptidase family serine peptidase [Methylomirabilota bacterium]|jgi:dipeptidyl aminopeptidase/acylaminoacyl peptidase
MSAARAALVAVSVLGTVSEPPPVRAQPPEAQEVRFESGPRTLRGFIYKPEGSEPFPVVLWNHGSEPRPGWLPAVAPVFTASGYVFFVPHRRGQGRSPGDYIMDLLRREREQRGPEAWSRQLVTLQEEHLRDQLAALAFVRALPYVDANRIAVAGCSFGGIQTILAAEQGHGTRAAVAFAAAAQTWKQSFALRDRLRTAVRQARVPVMFVQAENDYDLEPSRALANELEKQGKPFKLLLLPPFGTSAQEGHELCVRGAHLWSAEVLAFLRSSMGP